MTNAEINRRVAELMGQGPQKEAGGNLWKYNGGSSHPPMFWVSEEKACEAAEKQQDQTT